MDPTLATFLLALCVLVAGVVLLFKAVDLDKEADDRAKQLFTSVGVLFGLLAAGGLGTLFASNAAETAADSAAESAAKEAAPQAANEAVGQVSEEITEQVESALEAPPQEGSKEGDGGAP